MWTGQNIAKQSKSLLFFNQFNLKNDLIVYSSLTNSKPCSHWLKLIDIWRKFNNLKAEKQGPATVFPLEGEGQDATLEN